MNDNLAIVTGSSRGLGLAFIDGFLAQHIRCMAISRSGTPRQHPSLGNFCLDLSRTEELHNWIHKELLPLLKGKKFRKLTLVNNAGRLGSLGQSSTLESIAESFQLNTFAPMELSRALMNHPIADELIIINITSGAAHKPYAGWLEYCSSKAALDMAGAVLHEDHRHGLYPHCPKLSMINYAPGVLDTDMQLELRQADKTDFPSQQRFLDLFSEGKLISPADSVQYLLENLSHLSKGEFIRLRYGDLLS